MCGEHNLTPFSSGQNTGSSPHVRGARHPHRRNQIGRGIIPACAGSTEQGQGHPLHPGDHPRMCGEHLLPSLSDGAGSGSSPHVRGAPLIANRIHGITGIIPACAGSTHALHQPIIGSRDHPRMCGEHNGKLDNVSVPTGSSPHVRGARQCRGGGAEHVGIIPACAGSTITLNLSTTTGRDHPRMCGEHHAILQSVFADQGSSPHVRGALAAWLRTASSPGIIPACAGSTRSHGFDSWNRRDHPRMCGEHRTVAR